MNTSLSSYCPACRTRTEFLVEWEYSGLNDSVFNGCFEFFECRHCGLVYNNSISDATLGDFYSQECSYFEKAHFDAALKENIQKYEYYTGVLKKAGLFDVPMADIGCGRGGYLSWVKKNGWKSRCTGVDIDIRSLPLPKTAPGSPDSEIEFREGKALGLPFEDGSQSLLTYFHVLEHIVDLDRVMKEAYRTLNKSGHILIEVPDAERYGAYAIGTAFWVSIREHVHHFSAMSVRLALFRNGFDVVMVKKGDVPTPEFSYPSLMVLARKKQGRHSPMPDEKSPVSNYVLDAGEKLKRQANAVSQFASRFFVTTFWGCSSELFSLLPAFGGEAVRLCDASKRKQTCMYKGIPITAPSVVEKEGALVIAPYLFRNEILNAAVESGWPKDRIYCLR